MSRLASLLFVLAVINLACDSGGETTPAVLTVSPTTLDFGSIEAGQSSTMQAVTVRNTGGSPLTVTAIGLSGADPGLFQFAAPSVPFTLAANASESVEVTATPPVSVAPGAFAASLSVESSAGNKTVALNGTATDGQASEVTVTYLGNDGIMLAFEDKKVLIDAIHTNGSPWVILPTAERNKLLMGQPPYDGIDLVLVTHNHGDHYAPTSINTVLASNPGARVIAPPQAVAGIDPTRIESVGLNNFGTEATRTVNGITLDVLFMHHFDQFGNDFSTVQNFVYRVSLGGKHFLHVGDVEYEASNFQPFNLASRGVDVIFMPTFNTLISAATRDLINAQVAPDQVVALHFFNLPSEATQVEGLFPNAILFTQAPTTLTF